MLKEPLPIGTFPNGSHGQKIDDVLIKFEGLVLDAFRNSQDQSTFKWMYWRLVTWKLDRKYRRMCEQSGRVPYSRYRVG